LPSCGGDNQSVASVSTKPARERLNEVDAPAIPPATTPCSFDATQMCNSDAETATALGGYDAALAEANRRIRWMCRWFGFTDCKAD
jgi:hypothetical protein